MAEGERRLAAIMFTDIVGYTALGQRNESLSLALVEEQTRMVRPILNRHNGREVKTIGDAFLVEFPNALDAVRCAYDVQRASRELNIAMPVEKKLRLRVGIHLGDVVEKDGDIFGDAVNVASRIESLAEEGGVCITEQVYDHVRNKFELPIESMGMKMVKNVEEPVNVYRIVMPWEMYTDATRDPLLPTARVAVLPFVNISPDPADEYFADGLTEELIGRLSQVKGLEVIARTSVMNYKKKEKSTSQIGRELNVGTIIEGSVRKAGNKIRVTAQLINARTEGHLWVSNYDRDLDDIFNIQSDIAAKVAESVPAAIGQRAPLHPDRDTDDVEGYTQFLRARQLSHQTSEESLREALKLFEGVVSRGSSFARAYVGLANCYRKIGNLGYDPYMESVQKAVPSLKKALELDPELAEAHAELAMVHYNKDELIEAEQEARKAIELNPSLPEAYDALSNVLVSKGMAEQAVRAVEIYYRLDPLRPGYISDLGRAYFYTGREADAVEFWKKTKDLAPYETYANLAEYHLSKESLEEASESIGAAEKLRPGDGRSLWLRGYLEALRGNRTRALETIELIQKSKMGETSLNLVGYINYALGDLDGFFECMNKAFELHAIEEVNLKHNPLFAKARTDPRYEALLAKMRQAFWPEKDP